MRGANGVLLYRGKIYLYNNRSIGAGSLKNCPFRFSYCKKKGKKEEPNNVFDLISPLRKVPTFKDPIHVNRRQAQKQSPINTEVSQVSAELKVKTKFYVRY